MPDTINPDTFELKEPLNIIHSSQNSCVHIGEGTAKVISKITHIFFYRKLEEKCSLCSEFSFYLKMQKYASV